VIAHEAIGPARTANPGPPWTAKVSACVTARDALRGPRNLAAFVISPDGQVNLFWKENGRVLLKRNVNTANPNMIDG
jgi:hypothetical protein